MFAEYGIDKICFQFFFCFIALASILFSTLRACRVRPFHSPERVSAAVFTFQSQSSITMEDNSLPFQALSFALDLLCCLSVSLFPSWKNLVFLFFWIFYFYFYFSNDPVLVTCFLFLCLNLPSSVYVGYGVELPFVVIISN